MRTSTPEAFCTTAISQSRTPAGSDRSARGRNERRISNSNRSTRRKILIEVLKHLESEYGLNLAPDAVRDLTCSHAGVDALFSFRSDLRLNDLRAALARLDSGTFGICIACKHPIARAPLDNDITMLVCPACEAELNHQGPPGHHYD